MIHYLAAILNVVPGFGFGFLVIGQFRSFFATVALWLLIAAASFGSLLGIVAFTGDFCVIGYCEKAASSVASAVSFTALRIAWLVATIMAWVALVASGPRGALKDPSDGNFKDVVVQVLIDALPGPVVGAVVLGMAGGILGGAAFLPIAIMAAFSCEGCAGVIFVPIFGFILGVIAGGVTGGLLGRVVERVAGRR